MSKNSGPSEMFLGKGPLANPCKEPPGWSRLADQYPANLQLSSGVPFL